ncbi:MAG: FAD-dependent oxidoreductase [Gammaproteobacteria bacterium TMED182]|nr:FAD-dependent oxidoreductase [Gammaproteobacteria bacterium]RPG48637.1 MAG: FAD-dependent oxidoreductase [Gammaproteobacteria bacterium TMED182]
MKTIAVIGGGISGLTVAYYLSGRCDVSVFERNDYLGGHTHTHEIEVDETTVAVDTGFIVYNDRTYPHFMALLNSLEVRGQPTEMSFSLKRPHLEYNGHNLRTLFAQKSNVLKPSFWGMLMDILRFNRSARTMDAHETMSLRDYCLRENFGKAFMNDYLVPMAAAIWSTGDAEILDFPMGMLAQFFLHHGLLDLKDRPQWYVVEGGSAQYVKAMAGRIGSVRTSSAVTNVRRAPDGVYITVGSKIERFDEVVFACHAPQSRSLLEDATAAESEILGDMRCSRNTVALHQDASVMPKHQAVWASWNYHATQGSARAGLTYYMNRLQNFETTLPVLVTLNEVDSIDPARLIKTLNYAHPIFDQNMLKAQRRHAEISGHQRTHYCGAYWFNGFHEDGVVSALRVVREIEASL